MLAAPSQAWERRVLRRAQPQPMSVRVRMTVDFMDAIRGAKKTVQVPGLGEAGGSKRLEVDIPAGTTLAHRTFRLRPRQCASCCVHGQLEFQRASQPFRIHLAVYLGAQVKCWLVVTERDADSGMHHSNDADSTITLCVRLLSFSTAVAALAPCQCVG